MKVKVLTLLVSLVCACGAFAQRGSSFYVSTAGDDANPGTQAKPWRTVQHAADSARAGSTVNVRGGIYEERVGISVIGSGTHIELLHNNVHHVEQTFQGRDAPGRGGNGFGIAVYGTAANTPISELVIDGNEVQMQYNMQDDVFKNNIVYAGTRCLISVNKSSVPANTHPVDVDYNLYYCASGSKASEWKEYPANVKGFEKYVQSTGNDRHSRFSDPRFVDPTRRDFHLRSDSPAIAAGTNAGLPVGEKDLDGLPRIKSGGIDIGCYQKR